MSANGHSTIDFSAAGRSILMARFDPDDLSRHRRVLVHGKLSLAPQGQSLSYALRDVRFEWLGQSSASFDQWFLRGMLWKPRRKQALPPLRYVRRINALA